MSLHQSGENELPLALPQPFPQKIKGIHKLSAEAFGKETLQQRSSLSTSFPHSCRALPQSCSQTETKIVAPGHIKSIQS